MLKVVVGVIFNDFNQIYICKRPLDKQLGGYYEFPGGKVEQGETEVDALKRELKEELVGDVSVLDHLISYEYHYDTFSIELCCYECRLVSKNLKSQEHIDEKFISIDSFDEYQMAPADIKVIELIRSMYE